MGTQILLQKRIYFTGMHNTALYSTQLQRFNPPKGGIFKNSPILGYWQTNFTPFGPIFRKLIMSSFPWVNLLFGKPTTPSKNNGT